MKLVLFLSFIFIVSCQKNTGRFIASIEQEQYQKANDCFKRGVKLCYKMYPYNKINRKFFEFEYQWLNRKNKLQELFGDCRISRAISCQESYGLYERSEKFRKLRKQFRADRKQNTDKRKLTWKNINIPFLDMTIGDFSKIVNFAKKIKRTYALIGEKFFNSATNATKFSSKLLNGLGIGFSGSAVLGLGGTIHHEAIVHNNQLALFCAPGIMAKTDISATADISLIKTLGCESNKDYRGKFLTFDAGISGTWAGVPVSAGLSYSLGMDVSNFLKILRAKKENGEFLFKDLGKDLFDFAKMPSTKLLPHFEDKDSLMASFILSKLFANLKGEIETEKIFEQQIVQLYKQEYESKKFIIKPLTYYIKVILKSFKAIEVQSNIEFKTLSYFLEELDRSLSACDAISGAAGLSVGLAPASVGITLYHYKQIVEINLEDLAFLASIGPKTILTLKLTKKDKDRIISSSTKLLRVLPKLIDNTCLYDASVKLKDDTINLYKLIRN